MPKVSVVMNCYNGAQYLKGALDSIYAQTFSDWEIIFWDNASTDDSAQIVQSYDARVKYFKGSGYEVLGLVRNKAVAQARGEYIAFLDCDDLWLPDKLEKQLELFAADTVLVYSNYIVKDLIANLDYLAHNPKKAFYSGAVTRQLCKKNFIGFQTAIVSRAALGKLDFIFDKELVYAADYDLYIRLSLLGNFAYTRQALVIYRKHKANFTNSRRYIMAHDFSYFLNKYKTILDKRALSGIANSYVDCVRRDLRKAGFKLMPAFLNLGFSLRRILLSFVFLLFTEEQLYSLKGKFESYGVLNYFLKLFYGIRPLKKMDKAIIEETLRQK